MARWERWENRERTTGALLRIWLKFVYFGVSLWLLGSLFGLPHFGSSDTLIRIIEVIVGAGGGFVLPVTAAVGVLPKIIGLLSGKAKTTPS